MIKVGITGQPGFVGTHLFNTLGLYPDRYERIPCEDRFFDDPAQLREFAGRCDVIVHLAALNRHNDPEAIYGTNLRLVRQLIKAMETAGNAPHVLFSSSTQEERDNPYGRSKKEGRLLFEEWAARSGGKFSGLVIPNVFGPFGNPYYNSVIATFSHQLTHGETPQIHVDGEVKLIYVSELVREFMDRIDAMAQLPAGRTAIEEVKVPHTAEIRVSELLEVLTGTRDNYFARGEIPALDDPFRRNLFNTFLTYIDHGTFFPYLLKLNTDQRGSFVETVKLHSGGQVSFSTTVPGITRGNHFHTRKAERFAVIRGKARIELRRIGTDKVFTFELDGNQPSFVDMPVWFTHNITNTGTEELFTIFWISEHYNPVDGDTFFEKV